MGFLLDTADLGEIRRCVAHYPLTGVTTNPSIIKKAGDVPFYEHLRAIRAVIGPERSLHAQVVADTAKDMLTAAHRILDEVDGGVFIKVPVTTEGLKTIKALKAEGVSVTATVVYDLMQAYLAIDAGADYIAPYCSRMLKLGKDYCADVAAMRAYIDRSRSAARILGASFHAMEQITNVIAAGAHDVTLSPAYLDEGVGASYVLDAVQKFSDDWYEGHGRMY